MVHYFLNYKKFIPNDHVDHVFDIDFKALYQRGIRLLLIDLDNTLIPYDEILPNQSLKDFFKSLIALGFETVIVSNNHYERINIFATACNVPFVSSAKKPTKFGFKSALKKVEKTYKKEEVCVIGDQLMTDIFGSKRMGFEAILVKPIKKKTEKWYTKLNRKIEDKMLDKIKKKSPVQYNQLNLGGR
ncbi:MAG: YqeG family HAD IIIA-type phosphatase [Candidatus Izemoplasmataceae bacterium]